MATADLPAEPHLQTQWGPAYLGMVKQCIFCGAIAAGSRFQVCESCRRELKRQSAERRAAIKPDWCLACYLERPAQGSIYCRHCARRFGEVTR
jgi:hypothetical protein